MATVPAGFVEATFIFNVTGSARNSTWSCGFDFSDFNTLSPNNMAEEIYNRFTTTGRPYLPANIVTGWSFLGVSVIKMLEDGPLIGQFLSTKTGTLSGAPVPANGAMLLGKATNTGGRRGRGRAFLPPCHIVETGYDGMGFTNSGTVATVLALYTAAFADLVSVDIDPVLFHASPPYTPSLITGWSMSSQLATQRRRMRK